MTKVNIRDLDQEVPTNVLVYFNRIKSIEDPSQDQRLRYPISVKELFIYGAETHVVHFTDAGKLMHKESFIPDMNNRCEWGADLFDAIVKWTLYPQKIFSIHSNRVAKLALRWSAMFCKDSHISDALYERHWLDLCDKMHGDSVLTFPERKSFDSSTFNYWLSDGNDNAVMPQGDKERERLIKLCLI
jgi:hypothetical protein